jgi:tetratricopeptide (TPR) repeat protein
VLAGLLALGWASNFPPLLGLLAVATALVFGLRLGLLALGERQLARGEYTRADKLIRIALKLNPWSADALVLRAQGLTHRGDDETAEHVLRRAASLYPDDHLLQNALAASILSQGRIAEGWQLARTQDTNAKLSPQVAQQIAWFALHLEDNPARARTVALQTQPDQLAPSLALPLLTTIAEANIALGAHDDARKLLADIEQQLTMCAQPQHAELLYHLGRLHSALNGNGAAYFRRSVELDPSGRYAQTAWRSAVSANT